MTKIDSKDKKLLYQLHKNPRQSLSKIGKEIGLSKDTVSYRINRLQKEGVIVSFFTNINNTTIGHFMLRFYYSFQFVSPEIKNEIIKYFVENKNTSLVCETEGAYDLQVNVFINPYTFEFQNFYDETQKRYRQYFDNQIITIFNSGEVFDCAFLSGKSKAKPLRYGALPLQKFDDLDISILRLIALNARKPTIDIARELNTTVVTINNRIKNMIKNNIILRFSTNIDWSKIGYKPYIVKINLKDYNNKYDIIKYIRGNPNLWFITYSIGGNVDLDFEFLLENITQLHEIIKDLSAKFPDSIKNFKYFSVKKINKWNHIPES